MLGSIAIALVAIVFVLAITHRRRRRRALELTAQQTLGKDPSESPENWRQQPVERRRSSLTGTCVVWKDPELLKTKIPHKAWKKDKVLSAGAHSQVFTVHYKDKKLVLKQVLPRHARDDEILNEFMDEIRVCSTLSHPHLVPFVGITWEFVSNLAYACEWMAHGDLPSMLAKHKAKADHRRQLQWFHSTSTELKCKAALTLNIVDALIYLHTLTEPVVHQDLKSSAVLFSHENVLQLSLFGIYRELSMNETMSNERNGTAWVAPEVLRGGKCSEHSNVYSLGVIMSELDACEPPYVNGVEGYLPPNPSNARIAIMVSAGSVQPELHEDCPTEIRQLIKKCLNYDVDDRPALQDVHKQLHDLVDATATAI
ncbi:TPA: hypothetical protein N0F65_010687 [Lagenidium giganteum]|uniref:Protein kinase domain-containing protein n=1 Tax=Lagenidium giganteum TaxID=4803 RepID=A0AAV2ZBL6_9STRA|nr:TPA: hypothetical protein N0F65_010687 [Lagenidium giganteum]